MAITPSAEALAEVLDVQRPWVSRVESSRLSPSPGRLRALCLVLRVDLGVLLSLYVSHSQLLSRAQDLLQSIHAAFGSQPSLLLQAEQQGSEDQFHLFR